MKYKTRFIASLQVGACIVSQHKQIMSVGYSRRLDDIPQHSGYQGDYS